MKLFQRTIRDLHQMLLDREISSVELTESVLGHIDAVGDKTKAYLLVTRELALRQAKDADERLREPAACRPRRTSPLAATRLRAQDRDSASSGLNAARAPMSGPLSWGEVVVGG